ncbi:Gfo/Idh/MocA family protein [Shouchella shacheensis]|uniref:Gfo/Idh/MocA family protein n=1 Tax=Shouchella shacheensis TaxID=1649580 RepID=UPI00073FC4A4|nr:Gfo/Idh/MocA family oxidoreductase [Shouchella shacheensis]
MAKLKVAIIGPGQVAEKAHLPFYRSKEGVEVVAVVGRNAERTAAYARRLGIPRYYTNEEEMYAHEQPDAVSICTPNNLHYEHVLKALSYHCHVLCEKPPAIKASQAKEMAMLAKKNKCLLAYNLHHRASDDARQLKAEISKGTLGEVYCVKAKALRRSGVPGWGTFTNKEIQGGGPLIDIGIHMLDAALYLLSFPKTVSVQAKSFQKIGTKKSHGTFGEWDPHKFTVEDSLFAFIELENDGLLQVETSFALQMKEESILNVELFGEEAGATLFPLHIYADKDGTLVHHLRKQEADSCRQEKSIHVFIDGCLGRQADLVTGEEGYVLMRMIEAIYESAEKGEKIRL